MRNEDVTHAFLLEFEILGVDDGRVDQVEAQGVGAELVQNLHGIRIILFTLRHLLVIGSQHEPIDDNILEKRFAKQGRRQYEQRIKSAPSLINTLCDEISREVIFKLLLILERIVDLGVRHGAQRARLLGSVHGVVVQARRDVLGSSSSGKLTITAGSTTSL